MAGVSHSDARKATDGNFYGTLYSGGMGDWGS
jgi:hypothetical protein